MTSFFSAGRHDDVIMKLLDNEDETDQSGSSVDIKSDKSMKSPESKKEPKPEPKIEPKVEPAPQPLPMVPEKSKTEILEQLNKEYSLDQKEIADADGPDEVRIRSKKLPVFAKNQKFLKEKVA